MKKTRIRLSLFSLVLALVFIKVATAYYVYVIIKRDQCINILIFVAINYLHLIMDM